MRGGMPIYPAHSPGSPKTKARGSPVAARRSPTGGMSFGSSRSEPRVTEVVTAKRVAKKLVTKKKSTSATSSPKKLAAVDLEPAQDPSTPHSRSNPPGSGGSPGTGSPSRFASYASLIETRVDAVDARSTPDAVATVDAMQLGAMAKDIDKNYVEGLKNLILKNMPNPKGGEYKARGNVQAKACWQLSGQQGNGRPLFSELHSRTPFHLTGSVLVYSSSNEVMFSLYLVANRCPLTFQPLNIGSG